MSTPQLTPQQLQIQDNVYAFEAWSFFNEQQGSRHGLLRIMGSGKNLKITYLQTNKWYQKLWYFPLHYLGLTGTSLRTIANELHANIVVLKLAPKANTLLEEKISRYNDSWLRKLCGTTIQLNENSPIQPERDEVPQPLDKDAQRESMTSEQLQCVKHFITEHLRPYLSGEITPNTENRNRRPLFEKLDKVFLTKFPNANIDDGYLVQSALDEYITQCIKNLKVHRVSIEGISREVHRALQIDFRGCEFIPPLALIKQMVNAAMK